MKIVLELSGFKPFEQVLDVRKNTTISPTLERAPRMARLNLQASADGAGGEVMIDGVPRGTIPNTFELTAGRHQVEVRKAGRKPFSDWVDLQEGELRTRDVSMESAEAPTGTLLVNSDAGGDVYVDGQRKDAAPAIINGLPAGDHVVEVKKDGFPSWRQTVTVPAGQQVKVAATFGAATNSSLRVISNEPDVEIFVDGESKGKAPVSIQSIKPGEHIVGGRKTRFKPMEQTVRVAPGENSIVSFRMEVAPPDRPRADAEGAVAGPQRRGVPRRLQPGPGADRPQRPGSRQALHRRPQGRLHRLQARGRCCSRTSRSRWWPTCPPPAACASFPARKAPT